MTTLDQTYTVSLEVDASKDPDDLSFKMEVTADPLPEPVAVVVLPPVPPALHDIDIDALKEIVIGLTARVNQLEFAMRYRGAVYQPTGLLFPKHQ